MTSREESHNPALADEVSEPVEKTYRVVGMSRVMEHDHGEEFTATLTTEQENSLTQYGHLEVVESHKVSKGRKTKKSEDTDTEESDTDMEETED